MVFSNKSINLFLVAFADKLPNDFFSDIAANVLIIVTLSPNLFFFHFLEYMQSAISRRLWGLFFLECLTFESKGVVDNNVVG